MGRVRAYHGDPAIKERYVARVRMHRRAGEIAKGMYEEHGGRGGAVVCTLHDGYPEDYEARLGIPNAIAFLEEILFEGLADEEVPEFPEAFLTAIPVGADLSLVAARFHYWLLGDAEHGVARFGDAGTRVAIERLMALIARRIAGDDPAPHQWHTAGRYFTGGSARRYDFTDARHAAYHAAGGVYFACDTSYYSDVGEDADDVTRAADGAEAAYQAAEATANARSFADPIAAAEAGETGEAWEVARATHFGVMRDRLLRLLALAPVTNDGAPCSEAL